jgi:hypothetical protein
MESIISDEFICSNDGENLCKKSQLYLSLKCANNANQYVDLGGDIVVSKSVANPWRDPKIAVLVRQKAIKVGFAHAVGNRRRYCL